MTDFRRQPEPVSVCLVGEKEDVDYWIHRLMRAAKVEGDLIDFITTTTFRIYPRAVND